MTSMSAYKVDIFEAFDMDLGSLQPGPSYWRGEGCDDGRVIIHLVEGYWFEHYQSSSKGVGDADDIAYAMEMIRPRPKEARW